MDQKQNQSRNGAMWWTPLPEGGIRRIWARKAGTLYFCAREVCDARQELSRTRIFAAESEAMPPEPEDVRLWSQARFAQLRTGDVAEAWEFLGADAIARCALEDADPALASYFAKQAPREDLAGLHTLRVASPG